MAKRLRTMEHAPMKAVGVTEPRLKDKKMVLPAFHLQRHQKAGTARQPRKNLLFLARPKAVGGYQKLVIFYQSFYCGRILTL